MLYRTVITSFLAAAAFAFSPSTPAQASGIQGEVRGVDGRPLQNAQVRIERKDKAGAPVTMQSNPISLLKRRQVRHGLTSASSHPLGQTSNVTFWYQGLEPISRVAG